MVWYGTTRTTAVAVASCISQKLRETEMVHHMFIALINILLLQSPLWLVKSFFLLVKSQNFSALLIHHDFAGEITILVQSLVVWNIFLWLMVNNG